MAGTTDAETGDEPGDGAGDGNNQSGENPQEAGTATQPPQDNEFLSGIIDKKWWNERATENTLSVSCGRCRDDPTLVAIFQRYVTLDLRHFLDTGKERLLRSSIILPNRMVPYNFCMDEDLGHDADVSLLSDAIDEMEKWHTSSDERKKFSAPMLPIIQSSGTGKTRLMAEIRKRKILSRLILLGGPDSKAPDTLAPFDGFHKLTYTSEADFPEAMKSLRAMVMQQCKAAISEYHKSGNTKRQPYHIVLMFDEAQHFFCGGKDDPAALFRALMWITREKPGSREGENKNEYHISGLVATQLNDAFLDSDISSASTRFLKAQGSHFEDLGAELYPPFFSLRTMSSLVKDNDSHANGSTEYERAIRYGRPLFGLMHQKDELDVNLSEIALKMILGSTNYHEVPSACMSVLGTRVQLGRTDVSVVSTLVAKGYAYLTYFRPQDRKVGQPAVAGFSFLPDPVCARLAMRLMDEHDSISQREGAKEWTLQGKGKAFWADQLGALYKNNLFSPDTGDLGEQAAALYLLFCGDVLREQCKDIYETFSVNLFDWLSVMANMGRTSGNIAVEATSKSVEATSKSEDAASASEDVASESVKAISDAAKEAEDATSESKESASDSQDSTSHATSDATPNSEEDQKSQESNGRHKPIMTVSCIQFTRINLRYNITHFCNQDFLRRYYEMGCAMFAFNNCIAFDLVVPIRIKLNGSYVYIPMFVSVKNYDILTPCEVNSFVKSSVTSMSDAGITKGLFLLMGVGGESKSSYSNTLGGGYNATSFEGEKAISDFISYNIGEIQTTIVPKVLCIREDAFRINENVMCSRPRADHISDILSNHSDLLNTGTLEWEKQFNTKQQSWEEKLPLLTKPNPKKDEEEYFRQTFGAIPRFEQKLKEAKEK